MGLYFSNGGKTSLLNVFWKLEVQLIVSRNHVI